MIHSKLLALSLLSLTHPGVVSSVRSEPTPRTLRGSRRDRGIDASAPSPAGVRWASSGGGWRAMVADMGYANAFQQAGLFDEISAVSTTSGGSWFSTQFFYSFPFHNRTLHSTPRELASFVQAWMDSYLRLQQSVPASSKCQKAEWVETLFAKRLGNANATELCNIFQYYEGDWAAFVQAMLGAASADYGDANWIHRSACAGSAVPRLAGVELLVQLSVAPTSKENSSLHYLSPGSPSDGVFAVPLPAQYAMKADGSVAFHLGLLNSTDQTLTTSAGPAPASFTANDFEEFHLYPPASQDAVLTQVASTPSGDATWPLPFGGAPTVTQLAASSSAAAGAFAGSVPTLLAQAMSVMRAEIEASDDKPLTKKLKLKLLNQQAESFYSNPDFANLAVCGAWPQRCQGSDGRLIDGAYTDGPSVAMNIGQYQSVDQADRTKTIRMIVTDNKMTDETNVKILSYFSTSFNAHAAPGEFVWQPASGKDALAQGAPVASPQIFQEYMDEPALARQVRPVVGTNVTYAVLKATTTNNPAFGVVAGQSVELLVLFTNSNVPTLLVGTALTEANMAPLADLAESLAGSPALVSLVRLFASGNLQL